MYDTITKTELISNFPASNYILYKKSKANKVVYLMLKPEKIDNFNFTYTENAKMLVNKIKFNADKLDKTTYGSVFFETMDNSNYLYTRKLLRSKILNQSVQQKWEQYQFLTTINSFISNNTEYDSLIVKSSTRFQAKIDSLLLNKPILSKNKVLDEITSLSKNEKVVMLNETHWLPKHRLLAYDMLDGLKKNNFNYLAIEAVTLGQDSIINSNNFASKSSGYYVREPYFSHFIRKAKSLGFKIIAYDDMNGNDRELAQALNIKKIFDSDPNAKVFVYAGIAHILESNTPKKWMAEIFKEKTGINPLTFDQTKIHAKTDSEIVLFDSKVFNNVDNLNTNVDFYIVNNLKPSLEEVYKKSVLKIITIDSKKFKNKEILIRVFNKNEYDKIGFNAIPIFITYQNSVNSKVDLRLPTGEYFISVLSDKEEKLYNDFHTVD